MKNLDYFTEALFGRLLEVRSRAESRGLIVDYACYDELKDFADQLGLLNLWYIYLREVLDETAD